MVKKFFDFLICHYCQTKIHNRGMTDGRYIWKTNYCCSACFQEQFKKEEKGLEVINGN